MPFEEFVDVLEAAGRLKIHPETVKKLIRRGEIPATKFSHKWWIRRDDLEQFAATYDPRPGRKRRLL